MSHVTLHASWMAGDAFRDLWEPLIALALSPDVDVSFSWVKGHSGDHWNDRVDELATMAADSGTGQSG